MSELRTLELALECLEETDENDAPAGEALMLIDDLVYEMRLRERREWLRGARDAMRRPS